MLALRYRSNNKERYPPHIPLPPIIQGKAKRHLALLTRPNLTQPIAPSPNRLILLRPTLSRGVQCARREPTKYALKKPNRLVDLSRN